MKLGNVTITKTYVLSLVEKVAAGFGAAFVSTYVMSGAGVQELVNLSVAQKALSAGVAGAVMAVYGIVAKFKGDPQTANPLQATGTPPPAA